MKTILKKIGLSLIWIFLIGIMIWQKDYNVPLLAGIATIIFLIWTVNMSTITNLSFDWNRKKVEMSRMYEETKKTATEVEITAATFAKTIKAFMNFNLADMQKQGRFGSNIPWKDAAKFVSEATTLKSLLSATDEETSQLILKSKAKVLELFVFDAADYFLEDKPDIDKLVRSGISIIDGQLNYRFEDIAIDFEGLDKLSDQVSTDKKTLWKREVDELKKYYITHFI